MYDISVKNLGPLDEGSVALGDLTVLCGDNNTGKSYLATTICGYFDYLGKHSCVVHAESVDDLIQEKHVDKLFSTGEACVKLPISDCVTDVLKNMSYAIKKYSHELDAVFAAAEGSFAKTELDASADRKLVESQIQQRLETLGACRNVHFGFAGDKLKLTVAEGDAHPAFMQDACQRHLSRHLMARLLAPPHMRWFHSNPARGGIVSFDEDLGPHEFITSEEPLALEGVPMQGRHVDRGNVRGKGHPMPVVDEMRSLRNPSALGKRRGWSVTGDSKHPHEYIEDMMGAEFRHERGGIRLASNNNDNEYAISLAMGSSSSQELAAVYFHLKHHADSGDLLMMDEPESHLSIGNQIMLAHLICALVNNGVKVMLSTHSEILIKEINNLIMFEQLGEEKKVVCKKFREYKSSTGLSRTNVKAYQFIKRRIKPCKVTKWGIVVPTMAKNIDKVNAHSVQIGSLLVEQES